MGGSGQPKLVPPPPPAWSFPSHRPLFSPATAHACHLPPSLCFSCRRWACRFETLRAGARPYSTFPPASHSHRESAGCCSSLESGTPPCPSGEACTAGSTTCMDGAAKQQGTYDSELGAHPPTSGLFYSFTIHRFTLYCRGWAACGCITSRGGNL